MMARGEPSLCCALPTKLPSQMGCPGALRSVGWQDDAKFGVDVKRSGLKGWALGGVPRGTG